TWQLRRLAAALEAKIGERVEPVSLAHSTKVATADLRGRPAELLEAALDRVIGEGVRDIVVVPLCIGPSHAVVRHVPAVIAERTQANPGVVVKLAAPLFGAGETRLAEILADHVRDELKGFAAGVRVAV